MLNIVALMFLNNYIRKWLIVTVHLLKFQSYV